MDRLTLMETFAAVVRLGNFSKAAKELGVTRSIVSRRIQTLESFHNTRLMNRNTHQLSLTGVGSDYYRRCCALLDQFDALDQRMREYQKLPRGHLNVLSSKTFGETILSPIVAEFCGAYPDISVNLTLGDTDISPYGLDPIAGGFDLAIRTLPVRDSNLIARPIAKLPRILVAAPHYLEKMGVPRNPDELVNLNCLDPFGATHFTWNFTGPMTPTSIRVSGTPRSNSSTVIRDAALHGLGIALLRAYLVTEDIANGCLQQVLSKYTIEERTLYFIYQRNPHQPTAMKLFMDHVIARVEQHSKRRITA